MVYEKTPYGTGMYNGFRQLIDERSKNGLDEKTICMADSIEIPRVQDPSIFLEMAQRIQDSGTSVIVVFSDFSTATQLFTVMKNLNGSRDYQYVGADGW